MSVHSVSVAKERLKNLLVSDRMQCTPEAADRLEGDLYHTVSKYVEVRRKILILQSPVQTIHINTWEKRIETLLKKLNLHYSVKDYKFSLVILVLILSIFGVFMVRSARADYTNNQIMGVVLGLIVMAVISLIDYKWILNLYWPLYVINLILPCRNLDPGAWSQCKRSDTMAEPWVYPVPAVRYDENPYDPLFCKIPGGQGRKDQYALR